MKRILLFIFICLTGSRITAQHIYPIRADSVRIYSNCDTAELIIENRTKDTLGFLYNKGKGRTEFRKLRLQAVNGNSIAIVGQDTLKLGTIIKTAVDTIYQSNGMLYYRRTDGAVISLAVNTAETLESVTSRGSSTTNTLIFNAAANNPTNGLAWFYNTDEWRVFVESPTNTPSGNMIFQAGDDDSEGWIFRHSLSTTTPATKQDVLSIGRNRFLYNGYTVYHSGNLPANDYIRSAGFESSPGFNSFTNYAFIASTNSSVNAPVAGETWWNIINTRHRNMLQDGNQFGMQIAGGMVNLPNRIFFRNQAAGLWNDWKEFWHSGNVTFALRGNNVAVKTEAGGILSVENWMRVGNNNGIYTPDGAYMYREVTNGWAARSGTGSTTVRLELQTGDGINKGGLYYDGTYLGIANASNGWRLRTDANNNLVVLGSVTTTSVIQTSLRSLKKEIQPFSGHALDILNATNVRTFIYKADSANIKHIGFIADEIPDEMASPGRQGVDQSNTVALLVKALQEMNAKVEELQRTVEALNKKVAEK